MLNKIRRAFVPMLASAAALSALLFPITALPASPSGVLSLLGALLISPSASARAAIHFMSAPQPASTESPSSHNEPSLPSIPPPAEPPLSPPTEPPLSPSPIEPRPPIPDEPIPDGMLPLLEQHYTAAPGPSYIPTGNALIRNSTKLPDSQVASHVGQPLPFQITPNSPEPQVLIMHTHATESYESAEHSYCDPSFTARSTDSSQNMIAVGAEMASILNAAGIHTLHDQTLHDYPSYTGSYEKSNQTVRSYLSQYPSIKVVIDVHRDAIQKPDGTRIKPIFTHQQQKSAQVMLICGADNGGNLPNFQQNLRFASAWQSRMEMLTPGLTRPLLFDYRYYNQDLTTGSLLIEVGGHANTLDEAKAAGRFAAQALAHLLLNP